MEIANLAPITIVIYANSHLSAIDAAREKVQVLLLDYLDKQDVSDPGAERRLEYEVASSCLGEHRMLGSRNNVVRLGSISQSNTFISLVELTFEFIGGSLAMAPASYKNIFGHTVAGRVQLYGDDMGISEPVKSCLPYAVVTGPSWPSWQVVSGHIKGSN